MKLSMSVARFVVQYRIAIFLCRRLADCSFILYLYAIWKVCRFHKDLKK
jgi:hypothetical protein